jgi:hypothetical protein
MPGSTVINDVLGSGKAPPGFADLFRVDPTNTAARRWWDNNLRSVVDAFQRGDRTWTYYGKNGKPTELAFTPEIMEQFDVLNLQYARQGLRSADTVKEAQTWTGRIITATKALERRGGQYTMDVYQKTFTDLERSKESALAGGRYAEYANLIIEQTQLARYILGLAPSDPLDPKLANNPYLTEAQRDAISKDLSKLAPRNLDDQSEFYNPDGDPVLGLMGDGGISTQTDGQGNLIAAELDGSRGYLQQTQDGRVVMNVVDPTDLVYDEATQTMLPSYIKNTVPVKVRVQGQDIIVRQPVTDGGAELPVWIKSTGAASKPSTPSSFPLGDARTGGLYAGPTYGPVAPSEIPGLSTHTDRYVVGGVGVNVPVRTMQTVERGQIVKWVSIDGTTWKRMGGAETPPPRIVLDEGVILDPQSGKWMRNGVEVDPTSVAHWWGARVGESGDGAPGASFVTRMIGTDGELDSRPTYVINSERDAQRRQDVARAQLVTKYKGMTEQYGSLPSDDSRDELLSEQRQRRTGNFDGSERQASAAWHPGKEADDSWAREGTLLPHELRQAVSMFGSGLKPVAKPTFQTPDARRELGLMPIPKPTLKPPPTPSLQPVQTLKSAKLNPVTKAKLAPLPKKPKKSNDTNADLRAEKNAANAARAASAKAAAKAKAKAAAAAEHNRITGHAVGTGQLE